MAKYFYDTDKKITQGGILKDPVIYSINTDLQPQEITLQYATIISQACDIQQSELDNNYLPNIMVLPMYILDVFKSGEHLQNCGYQVKQRTFGTGEIPKLIKNSEFSRYHFLPKGEHLLHDVVIDFKHYYTLPKNLIINQYQGRYIATIDYLYRELLSQRFCNYLGRIGLPA